MRAANAIAQWNQSGLQDIWVPTELHRIGKNEEFLQRAIERTPELLGLESRRTGIRGPYVPFLELPLSTPTGRLIYPDIVFLTGSGHILIVEVKLSVNSELRDRDVIAQIIDYASSISCLSRNGLCDLFDKTQTVNRQWPLVIQRWFAEDTRPEELAEVFYDRIQRGEVNIVIACDRLPPGTAEIVASISAQRTLGFACDVVEVVPYVHEEVPDAELLLVPTIRLSTEIVARTAVTVTYQTGQLQPSTAIQISTLEEIETKVKGAEKKARIWNDAELDQTVRDYRDPTTISLLDLCRDLSAEGTFNTAGEKINPCFGYHLSVELADGKKVKRSVFSCVPGWKAIFFYLDTVRRLLSEADFNEFCNRLKTLFGAEIDVNMKQPGVPIESIQNRFVQFAELMTWLKVRSQ